MKYSLATLVSLSLILPQLAFGLGASVDFTKMQQKPKGSTYVGIGQKTREMRIVSSDAVFLEYQLNGEARRVWDDDGLGVLFLYQRYVTGQKFEGNLELNSPLPMPKEPLLSSLATLEKTYIAMVAWAESKQDSQTVKRAKKLLRNIQKVKDYVSSDRFRTVSDLQASGLESLVNDLDSNHTYMAEIGNDQKKRARLSELFAQGAPATLDDESAARCRDTISLNWKALAAGFADKGGKFSGNGQVLDESGNEVPAD